VSCHGIWYWSNNEVNNYVKMSVELSYLDAHVIYFFLWGVRQTLWISPSSRTLEIFSRVSTLEAKCLQFGFWSCGHTSDFCLNVINGCSKISKKTACRVTFVIVMIRLRSWKRGTVVRFSEWVSFLFSHSVNTDSTTFPDSCTNRKEYG
jgi:hypothetical protein